MLDVIAWGPQTPRAPPSAHHEQVPLGAEDGAQIWVHPKPLEGWAEMGVPCGHVSS